MESKEKEAILNKFKQNVGHNPCSCVADAIITLEEILNAHVQETDKKEEEYQRLLYWVLMEKQGQKVPWNGKFVYDHENGLAWFDRWTKEEWEEYLRNNPLPAPPVLPRAG